MRTAAACVLLFAAAAAQGSDLADAARAARARRESAVLGVNAIEVRVGASRTLAVAGATAAWPVDPVIAEVTLQAEGVVVFGRSPGSTKIVVVAAGGSQRILDVAVEARPSRARPSAHSGTTGRAELRYASAARELQQETRLRHEGAARTTEVEVRTVHQNAQWQEERAKTSVPSLSYRVFTPGREVTFFDRAIDHSPLTLTETSLRGMHYLDGHWRLHAGYTTYASFQSFLIPLEKQLVAGGGYAFRAGSRATLMPSLFHYRGQGTAGSLTYEYVDRDRLEVLGEVGYGGALGGAARVAYDSARNRVRADVRYRPDGFAAASLASAPGFQADASWAHEYAPGSLVSSAFSAADVGGAQVRTASTDVEHRLTRSLSLTGGAAWAAFDKGQSWTVPGGIRLDYGRVAMTALARYSSSPSSDGGLGFRLSARGTIGSMYASAYFDRQENAPTLELVFAERPDLALALDELGITATTIADLSRALRQNAALIELGFVEGVTIDLVPMRTQSGLEMAWTGVRQQVRTRLIHNVTESVTQRTTSTIATLTYARQVGASTDLFASGTWWRTERRGSAARVDPFFEVGVRHRFDRLPGLLGGGSSVEGTVFRDEDLDGRSDGAAVQAVLELDGTRSTQPAADGSFRFAGVSGGTHRVVARVADSEDAYFTTPSSVEVEPGQRVGFGVASTPARLFGTVKSDAGVGVGGVRVLLRRGARTLTAETASDGSFRLAAPAGEWQAELLGDSIPAGYALGIPTQMVMLDPARPASVDLQLRAHRTVNGTTTPGSLVTIAQLSRSVRADAQGRFTIRSLPPGQTTLVSGASTRVITLPPEPATVQVEMVASTRAIAPAAESAVGYVVQIGVFRVPANAEHAAAQALESGVNASLQKSGATTTVQAGPYRSRGEATATAALLTRAGLEALVLSSN
jgi:hypothetical protein